QYSSWPEVRASVVLIAVMLPKARRRLYLFLHTLAASLQQPTELWLVGPVRGGIRGTLKQLNEQAEGGNVKGLENARHSSLYSIMLQPQAGAELAQFASRWQVGEHEYMSYPGVFSHGRLDDGTALLLSVLPTELAGQRVLDMGCGA